MTDTIMTDGITGTISHVDPSTLLLDANIRDDVEADKDFIASLRDFGVLQPIVAVRTTDGPLRVRFGKRRTLGAIAAGLPTVPVHVAGDERTDKPAVIERLLTQYAENEHRKGLTTAETVKVVEQLALLDVSAAQIAKRTQLKRADVDQALTVAGSQLAQASHVRYDLTLDQAAAVAEFEDDTEAVKALVAAAKKGGFDHALERARQRRNDAHALAEFTTEYEAKGLRVVPAPGWNDKTPVELASLSTLAGKRYETPEQHAECPGHVVWPVEEDVYVTADGTVLTVEQAGQLEEDQYEDDDRWQTRLMPTYGCADPAGNDHLVNGRHPQTGAGIRGQSTDEATQAELDAQAAQQEERRRVIANNKAWAAATEVRGQFIRDKIAARKSPPKGTAAFTVEALARDAAVLTHPDAAAQSLGWLSGDPEAWLADASEARAQVVALVLVLASYEREAGRESWRYPQRWTKRYLLWLQDHGYTLADVERLAAGLPVDDAEEA